MRTLIPLITAGGLRAHDKILRLALALLFLAGVSLTSRLSGQTTPTSATAAASAARLTVLCDNTAARDGVKAVGGFACLVEAREHTVLFDTGAFPAGLKDNLAALKINPSKIEAIVISHYHNDHTQGAPGLSTLAGVRTLTPHSFDGHPEQAAALRSAGLTLVPVSQATPLFDGIGVSEPLHFDGKISMGVPGKEFADELWEQCLTVDTPAGLVVIAGCSHAGILPMLEQIKQQNGRPLHLVIGGFHLLGQSDTEVRRLAEGMQMLGVAYVSATHCTGAAAARVFRDVFRDRYVSAGAGAVIDLPLATTAEAPAQTEDDRAVAALDRREVMIPMRDGIRLFTLILTPKAATEPLPLLLSRTPYGTSGWGGTKGFANGCKELCEDGYIFVFQDIRGRYKSEGQFVMTRPPRDRRDPRSTDETTDTWDTIEWLVRNIPGNNGRVGMLGISYPGWLTDVAMLEPHPALKATSPQAPPGDMWMGDDFFHQGAFRLSYGLEYAWWLEASADQSVSPSPARYDTYDWYLSFPTLKALADAVGAMQWPTWCRFAQHPAYDEVWQQRALVRYLKRATVPALTVGGWWDAEDMYGSLTTYATMESSDTNSNNHFVMGPWNHGLWAGHQDPKAEALGNLRFGSPTGEYFRKQIQARWFAFWLKGKGDGRFPEATVFDAGANAWLTFDTWPPKQARVRKLYLHETSRLSFDPPTSTRGFDAYVSDPAHPVPYRVRPVEWTYDPRGSHWDNWMAEDQRFVHNRPDVLSWETPPLAEDVTIAGNLSAHLYASTTGSDADWVVKLIDVYPDAGLDRPAMGGYQLMIAGDILRGRYRKSFERAQRIPPGKVQMYTVDLHQQCYRFKKGHRIMVQIQSTWFPLYDRNPQVFVPNIFEAKATDYRAQTHRIYRTSRCPSHVEVMILP